MYDPTKGTADQVGKPGYVSAYKFAGTQSPVTDTSGIRTNVNKTNTDIGNVNLNIPVAPIFGQYTSDQNRQIENAGVGAAGQYDKLIGRAQEEKRQGMAKNTVAAGERGGFMNSQFSGVAANQETVGGNFIGMGGELERIKSAYDLNIQDLQVQKISAVAQAKQSMQQYIDTGKQQDYENARTAYQDARQAEQDQQRAAAEAQKAALDAQKASFDLSQPLSSAGEDIQKWALTQLGKYPGVMSAFIEAGGTPEQLQNLNANQLAYLISQDPGYQADQLKASLGPGSIGEYQYAVSQGYEGSFTDYQNEDANRKASIARAGAGGGINLGGGLGGGGVDLSNISLVPTTKGNAGQQTAGGYAIRINDANKTIANLEGKFVGANDYITSSQYYPNWAKSGDRQKFEQASRNFINSVLRKESGAAISESEFENAKQQYIPQPGDSADVLAQKKQNRETALQGMISAAGPALTQGAGGGGSLADQVKAKGYDYAKMHADGLSDADIKSQLGL